MFNPYIISWRNLFHNTKCIYLTKFMFKPKACEPFKRQKAKIPPYKHPLRSMPSDPPFTNCIWQMGLKTSRYSVSVMVRYNGYLTKLCKTKSKQGFFFSSFHFLKATKEPGCSWIELKSLSTHAFFVVGDDMHPQIDEIRLALKLLLTKLMKDEGCQPLLDSLPLLKLSLMI